MIVAKNYTDNQCEHRNRRAEQRHVNHSAQRKALNVKELIEAYSESAAKEQTQQVLTRHLTQLAELPL
jgi:hypothetical protein